MPSTTHPSATFAAARRPGVLPESHRNLAARLLAAIGRAGRPSSTTQILRHIKARDGGVASVRAALEGMVDAGLLTRSTVATHGPAFSLYGLPGMAAPGPWKPTPRAASPASLANMAAAEAACLEMAERGEWPSTAAVRALLPRVNEAIILAVRRRLVAEGRIDLEPPGSDGLVGYTEAERAQIQANIAEARVEKDREHARIVGEQLNTTPIFGRNSRTRYARRFYSLGMGE